MIQVSDERQKILIDLLENLVYPKFIEEKLEEIYDNPNPSIQEYRNNERIEKEEKISIFFDYDFVRKALASYKSELNPLSIIRPLDSSCDFKKASYQCSLYFKQGKELLSTAIELSEFTSPIIQYYGLLQCIKGIILLDYELSNSPFFSYHGIREDKCTTILTRSNTKLESKLKSLHQNAKFAKLKYPLEFKISNYCNAKIMPFGVFTALLIHQSKQFAYTPDRRTDMDYFLSGDCSLSLEELVNSSHMDIYKVFIISWTISTIVRYKPTLWQEIVSGSKDTIIKQLIDFMRYEVPNKLQDILNPYLPYRQRDFV